VSSDRYADEGGIRAAPKLNFRTNEYVQLTLERRPGSIPDPDTVVKADLKRRSRSHSGECESDGDQARCNTP
jgi:hypothetical protein